MLTNQEFLTAFAPALMQRIGKPRFSLYFERNSRLQWEDGALTISVPNRFFQEWIVNRFLSDVRHVAEQITGGSVNIRFAIDPELFQDLRQEQAEAETRALEQTLHELTPPAPPSAVKPAGRWHTLDDFVVGDCNRLAYTAAKNLIDRVQETPNLITLHGGTGVGKTHLLEGLYTEMRRTLGEGATLCISAEEFTNRFQAALVSKQMPQFRRQFRDTYALFVDNIQFLSGKQGTQEEFLHTYEALHRLGRPVIVTCDVPPRQLKDFSPQLLDRLLGGGVWAIEPPDHDTRLRILRAKAEQIGLALPKEAVNYLADRLRGNVRELDAALYAVRLYQQVHDKPITIDLIRAAIANLVRPEGKLVTMEEVEQVVCKQLNMDVKTLHTPSRARLVSHARMLTMYLMRLHTKASAQAIAQHFGYRSHSIVMAAMKKVEKWLEEDEPLFAGVGRSPVRELVENIEKELNRL